MVPPSLSNDTLLSDINLLYDQAVACFIDEHPGDFQLDKNSLTRLTTSLCSQIAQNKFKAVAMSLYSIKEHLGKLKARVKNPDQMDEALLFMIDGMINRLREENQKTRFSTYVNYIKKLMDEVKELRKRDTKFGFFPVTPDDLYSRIWSLIPLDEKNAIFPQAGVPFLSPINKKSARTNQQQTIQSFDNSTTGLFKVFNCDTSPNKPDRTVSNKNFSQSTPWEFSFSTVDLNNNPWEVTSSKDNPRKVVHVKNFGEPQA